MKLYQNLNVTGSLTLTGSLNTIGTITATTLVVQTITSSISAITGSTKFGELSTNTHQFTGSMFITGGLSVTTGNVGIGTISPSTILDISTATAPSLLVTMTGDPTNQGTMGAIRFVGKRSTYGTSYLTSIEGYQDGGTGDYNGLRFITSAGSQIERMRITSAGNVGIGTSSPATFLHVLGANTSARGQLCIQSNNSSNAAKATWYYDTFNSGEIGTTSSDFYALATNNFLFYAGGNERMRIDTNGLITAPYMTGKSFAMTSGGGTGTAITDTGIYVGSGDWGGFGRSTAYLVTFSANPNNGGSGEYSASHVGYINVYTGYSGSNVTTYIGYTQLAVGNNIGALTLSPTFWNGSSESGAVTRASITGYQIRIKISGYNSSYTGANQALYIQKVLSNG